MKYVKSEIICNVKIVAEVAAPAVILVRAILDATEIVVAVLEVEVEVEAVAEEESETVAAASSSLSSSSSSSS